MKKRALGIILSVLCVLLLFSACGGKDKKEKKKSDEAKVKVEKEESEEKEDEEEEVKLSPEEGTPFTTEAVRDVTMGPVTVRVLWKTGYPFLVKKTSHKSCPFTYIESKR